MDCGNAVLQQRLPGQQHHSRLQRPGLSRRLEERVRGARLDQQLSRVHRPHLPGAVRGGVHAQHQRRPGRHQVDRARDHRPRLGRGLRRAAAAGREDRQDRRRRRLRAGRPRRRAAARARRPCGDGVRAQRRASAACCATAFPTSRWRSRTSTGASRRWRPKASSSGPASASARPPRRGRHRLVARIGQRRRAARRVRRGRCSPPAPSARATCPCRAAISTASTSRWSSCRSRTRSTPAARSSARSAPTARTSSSSAAATPAATASVRATGTARRA